jgi:ribulose-5-phosphate 4-epimerase/fuculose-1-phosphate aldolase
MSLIAPEILEEMLPRAAAWAAAQEQLILRDSRSLILVPQGQEIARRAGVSHPENVRLLAVPEIPLPAEADLRQAARQFDLITQDTAGLTIGHGIFVREQCLKDAKLVTHELMHVAQYERHGSILGFLARYLSECNEFGYPAAPMEQEAIAFAESICPQTR